ncbi:hypothetical protein P4907_12795 [Escherichia coli]|jgi:hypothetical protein
MTLILAGASLRFCSTEDAVTTIVSPSSSTANTGHAQEIADKHSPTRTKGFNLNIPYLHEVTTKIKWVIAHIFFTSPCVRQHRGGLIFYAGDHPRKPEQPLICQPFLIAA